MKHCYKIRIAAWSLLLFGAVFTACEDDLTIFNSYSINS